MYQIKKIIGSGGKPKAQTRVTTADNLFSRDKVELVIALGEGPIYGFATPDGLDVLPRPDFRNFFIGDIPLRYYKSPTEPDASNFDDLIADIIPGSSAKNTITLSQGGQSNSIAVGVNVTHQQPMVRYTPSELRGKITKLEVRLTVTQLYVDNDTGTYNNTLELQIEYKKAKAPDITFTKYQGDYWDNTTGRLKITGKTSSGFSHDFVITLPTNDPDPTDDWVIRVTKLSPDYDPTETTSRHLAEFTFESYQCITTRTLSHANLAMIHVLGKSTDQFNSIPDFTSIVKGLIIKVPSNYNPDTIGIGAFSPINWNGVLKDSWTNNNAWVFYDLVMNPRYGLKAHSPNVNINLGDVYNAGLYCNESVLNGTGFPQKRYTFTAQMAENQSARDVLAAVAATFDAIFYDDGNGNISLKIDSWVEPFYIYTPECITPDGFIYSSSDITTRANDITVSFINAKLGFVEDRRRVTFGDPNHPELDPFISKNGRVPLDFVAVGCTDEDEAIRRAMFRLLSANLETWTVTFNAPRSALMLEPYDIIYVADPNMSWSLFTGRIESVNGRTINLRDSLSLDVSKVYDMKVQTFEGVCVLKVKSSQNPGKTLTIQDATIPSPFVQNLVPQAAFAITNSDYDLHPFRVISVDKSDNPELLKVTCTEVSIDKFNHPLIIVNNSRIININVDVFDYNLYDEYFKRFGAPSAGVIVEFRIKAGVLITSTSITTPALDTGVWPAGVTPKVTWLVDGALRSIVAGRGGDGGDGGGIAYYVPRGGNPVYGNILDRRPGTAGQNGGIAVIARSPVVFSFSSNVRAIVGGGGGGSGSGCGWSLVPFSGIGDGPFIMISGNGGCGGWPYGKGGKSGGLHPYELPDNPAYDADSFGRVAHTTRGLFGTDASRDQPGYISSNKSITAYWVWGDSGYWAQVVTSIAGNGGTANPTGTGNGQDVSTGYASSGASFEGAGTRSGAAGGKIGQAIQGSRYISVLVDGTPFANGISGLIGTQVVGKVTT